MAVTIDGTSGINTPGVVNTAAETIATTLAVTGATTVQAGTAALPAITTTGDTNTGIFFPAADTVAVSTGGSERLRVDSSGNVGIGTSSPTARLNVSATYVSDTTVQTRFSDNTGGRLEFGGNASAGKWINANDGGTSTAVPLIFQNGSNVERARIDSSGNLLVGTTSTDTTAVGIRLMNNNQVQASKSSDWSFRMGRRDSTGIITEIYYNSNRVGDIATNGTGTFYNSASDYRLKEDIVPMTDALARNALLNPVKYKWKIDSSEGEGFIADQLQGPFPSAVTGEKDAVDADGNPIYQSIGTGPLDGHFAACVNELQAIIQEQQALITALTTRITALEAA